MDADATEDAPLPGYSVPIRAPLTIDSDSEFSLSVNAQIYSRTSSFNSTSSSSGIDISSHDDEHNTSIYEEYLDEEIVIENCSFIRPFVRYPDANYVKESSDFSEFTIFRPFVKIPCEESSGGGDGGFAVKLSVPIAPLTGDSDGDSIGDDSVDGTVRAPKVGSFNGDEGDDELQAEGVLSGDDIIGVENLDEVVKFFESDTSSFDLERIDAQTVSSSNSEIERKVSESDELSFDSERIDVQIVPNSDSEIENEGCKVECLNEGVKLFESDTLSFDLERLEEQTVSSSNNETEIETIDEKLLEPDEVRFDSKRIGVYVVLKQDGEIENLNFVSTESVEHEGCKVECLNEVVKLSESGASSFDLERIDTQTVSSSNNEIEIETVNGSEREAVCKNEEETLKKTQQRVRARFLRLALNEQLTTKVNEKGGNYKFDFALTILAIGKAGVGKSAMINSIFGEKKATTNAFDPGTTSIQEITGNVDGIQLRVIDTPGLKCSSLDRSYNLRVLNSIKRFTRKHASNVVLYVDRLDTLDVNDSHLLTMITNSLGSSVWHRCIIALTHAGCDPSHEPSKGFMVRRCRSLQEQIISFGGNIQRVANPVWLVDNHPSYTHDVIDLHCGFKGLVCSDPAEDVEIQPFEPLHKPRNVINRGWERRDAYYGYRVKLVGNNHWSVGCRLWF